MFCQDIFKSLTGPLHYGSQFCAFTGFLCVPCVSLCLYSIPMLFLWPFFSV